MADLEEQGFRKIKFIGHGQYGTVILYYSKKYRKEVVIKSVRYDKKSENDIYVKREVQILLHIVHPNIIKCLDYFYMNETIYIVMEYAVNGTLRSAIEKARRRMRYLSEPELYAVFLGICLGLEKLHDHNIIHRDLKPENILIGGDGKVKIADFGISKVLHVDDSSITRGLGTPLYAAPEVLLMKPYTFTADIWSLGCIFYELCTLHHPFEGSKSQTELLTRIKYSKFKPIENRKLGLRGDVKVLCNMMLKEDSMDRYTIGDIVTHPCLAKQLYQEMFVYNY